MFLIVGHFQEYNAHPPHAINQTDISAHSCNPSEQFFFQKGSDLFVRNSPHAGEA